MKPQLLFVFCLITCVVLAQQPVQSYYGTNQAVFEILQDPLDHSATGANVTWNFSDLSPIGLSLDSESAPTEQELSAYPGTTTVVTTNSIFTGVGESTVKVYSKYPGNTLSLTGVDNSPLLLNYTTDNATLGLFPMEYGFDNVDNIAGNYDNGEYAGTFNGTMTTTVDAWGLLSVGGSIGNPHSESVTRLKSVQNISLNYGIFTNVGTITVTNYAYYGTSLPTGIPRLRSTTTVVNVPLLSINQTVRQEETFSVLMLGTKQNALASSQIHIAPNPVENQLNIRFSERHEVRSVILTDVTGKVVLTRGSSDNGIDVSHLQKGIYFANIETDLGTTVKKFIKK